MINVEPRKYHVPSPEREVVLRQQGQYLSINPPVSNLEAHFYTAQLDRLHGQNQTAVILACREPLIWEISQLGKPVNQCFAGLTPLITELLQSNGIRVKHAGEPLAALPEPDSKALTALPVVDTSLLHFIHGNERGMIRYHRQGKVNVGRLVGQICLAWPEKRIVIVATRVEDAKRLRRQLLKYVDRVGLLTSRNTTLRSKRVVVGTRESLAGSGLRLHSRHIYIAMNPDELFSGTLNLGIQGIQNVRQARLFGLLPVDVELAPYRRDLVTALFGVEELVIPRHGYRPLPVEVVFSAIRGGARIPDHRDDFLIKRLGVHEHHVRNRRIKHLANALADKDIATLKEKFPEVATRLSKEKNVRVGVLVDNVTHGLTLARLLNWPLVVSPLIHQEGLSDVEKDFIKRGMNDKIRVNQPVVVTDCGLGRAGKFDVIIRADGGVDLPAIPHAKLCVPQGTKRRLLLIDFRDEHHPKLRRWSRQRRLAYIERGWTVAGETKQTPLQKFIATRPEVVR